jgi:hypothetical protein
LNALRLSDITQTEKRVHIAEPLVPESRPFRFEISIASMTNYKSPGTDQIPAELIQAGGERLRSKIHKLINSTRNKEELVHQWKASIIVPT